MTDFDESLALLAADMRETMLAAPGAGLAAPQIDRRVRLIVAEFSDEGEEYGTNVLTLANPEIIEREGAQIYEEGCLSVEDLTAEVNRAEKILVKAQSVSGEPFLVEAEGRKAVILQHEIDHLDGVLFIDHLSRLKREVYHKRLKKGKREEE